MKIGIDARLYRSSVAGIGRYSQNLIKNLLAIDSENQYVLFMTPEDAAEYRKNVKLQISNVKIKIVDIPHYSIAEQMKLPKIIAQEKCDLAHFLNFNFPVSFKGKFIVTIHDLTLFFYPGRAKNNFIYKLAYKYIFSAACRKSEKIIAVSKSTKNDIIRVFKTDPQKIKVIYEAADDKTFNQASEDITGKLKLRYAIGNMPILLYVGQWRQHKNLIGLIKAFEILRKKMPVKLAIVGKADAAYPEVLHAIDNSPYLRDIIRPGFVLEEELAAWYKVASVFVFPSFYEGFGLPGLEAMMAGLPVVASNRTSLPEIYRDGAVYFDPDDVSDMTEKIQEVILNKNISEKLVANGHKIAQSFSWAKTAQETLGVYREILKN